MLRKRISFVLLVSYMVSLGLALECYTCNDSEAHGTGNTLTSSCKARRAVGDPTESCPGFCRTLSYPILGRLQGLSFGPPTTVGYGYQRWCDSNPLNMPIDGRCFYISALANRQKICNCLTDKCNGDAI